MQNPVQVIEKNAGPKIEWRQNGYKLIFGDDDLTFRCDTRQKDWLVHEDISLDDNGNLKIGVGKYYVAQVDIPAKIYTDIKVEDLEEPDGESAVIREPIPLDMADVILTLWSMDGIV